MGRFRTLSSSILLAVLAILLGTVVIGGILDVQLTQRSLDQQYEERARAVAAVVAADPQVRSALLAGDPTGTIRVVADRDARAAGATYVVVTDRSGLRFSHPNPALIGQRLEEPVAALDGHDHVGIDNGSLGRSANGKAPILDADGHVVGQVSVGILETEVAKQVQRDTAAIVAYSALALGVGALVSLLLARALKRLTFGLELREISALLQEREAMLHGIREGVLGLDAKGRVSLVNDETRRLLNLSTHSIGSPLHEVVPAGRLREVLDGSVDGVDQSVVTPDSLLVVNRRPVIVAGRHVGSIVTLRDRTELEALMRRMNAVTGLINALRAQEHEFTNRLHVISGLIDLGEVEEARHYLHQIVREFNGSGEDLQSRIGPPSVVALLRAKMAVAAEHDVTLSVTPDSSLESGAVDTTVLMTVLGNLIDNAVEACPGRAGSCEVTVTLRDGPDGMITVLVDDTGPGISDADLELVFADGYTTKPPRGDLHRGIGLALVRRLVARAGGSIRAAPGPGGHFEAHLPAAVPSLPSPPTASFMDGAAL